MRRAHATCVVMATRDAPGSHFLIGSVAEKVVRHSPRRVLTVRATAAGHGRAAGAAPKDQDGAAANELHAAPIAGTVQYTSVARVALFVLALHPLSRASDRHA